LGKKNQRVKTKKPQERKKKKINQTSIPGKDRFNVLKGKKGERDVILHKHERKIHRKGCKSRTQKKECTPEKKVTLKEKKDHPVCNGRERNFPTASHGQWESINKDQITTKQKNRTKHRSTKRGGKLLGTQIGDKN